MNYKSIQSSESIMKELDHMKESIEEIKKEMKSEINFLTNDSDIEQAHIFSVFDR
jgi:hypothetical protein